MCRRICCRRVCAVLIRLACITLYSILARLERQPPFHLLFAGFNRGADPHGGLLSSALLAQASRLYVIIVLVVTVRASAAQLDPLGARALRLPVHTVQPDPFVVGCE